MAANTSGNKNLDSIVTGELCLQALEFTKILLKKMTICLKTIYGNDI